MQMSRSYRDVNINTSHGATVALVGNIL